MFLARFLLLPDRQQLRTNWKVGDHVCEVVTLVVGALQQLLCSFCIRSRCSQNFRVRILRAPKTTKFSAPAADPLLSVNLYHRKVVFFLHRPSFRALFSCEYWLVGTACRGFDGGAWLVFFALARICFIWANPSGASLVSSESVKSLAWKVGNRSQLELYSGRSK